MAESLVGRVALSLLRLASWGYYLLPRPAQSLLDGILAALLRSARVREKVIRQNLEIAFPGEENSRKREKLLKAAYSHLARLSFEILFLFGPMRKYVRNHCELQGFDHWKEAKSRGRGVLFLASHVGNWEIMAAVGALHGMDILLVTKLLKPAWFHRGIETGRLRCGVRGTYEPRTLKDVLSHLKKNGTVGFVLDQYAGPPVGVRVPVFGTAVGTSTALATLAKRTGAIVLPVVNYRTPGGRLLVRIEPPIEWLEDHDPVRELARNTANYANRVEIHILEHPEQWLWTHRRFKGNLEPLREDEWSDGRPRK